jgi:hypothetical protein
MALSRVRGEFRSKSFRSRTMSDLMGQMTEVRTAESERGMPEWPTTGLGKARTVVFDDTRHGTTRRVFDNTLVPAIDRVGRQGVA